MACRPPVAACLGASSPVRSDTAGGTNLLFQFCVTYSAFRYFQLGRYVECMPLYAFVFLPQTTRYIYHRFILPPSGVRARAVCSSPVPAAAASREGSLLDLILCVLPPVAGSALTNLVQESNVFRVTCRDCFYLLDSQHNPRLSPIRRESYRNIFRW
jgi:hypothetical protein